MIPAQLSELTGGLGCSRTEIPLMSIARRMHWWTNSWLVAKSEKFPLVLDLTDFGVYQDLASHQTVIDTAQLVNRSV